MEAGRSVGSLRPGDGRLQQGRLQACDDEWPEARSVLTAAMVGRNPGVESQVAGSVPRDRDPPSHVQLVRTVDQYAKYLGGSTDRTYVIAQAIEIALAQATDRQSRRRGAGRGPHERVAVGTCLQSNLTPGGTRSVPPAPSVMRLYSRPPSPQPTPDPLLPFVLRSIPNGPRTPTAPND